MKKGDIVEVLHLDKIDEEHLNWINSENKYAYLRDNKKIKKGDRLEIEDILYTAIRLKKYQYYHSIKRFKLIESK